MKVEFTEHVGPGGPLKCHLCNGEIGDHSYVTQCAILPGGWSSHQRMHEKCFLHLIDGAIEYFEKEYSTGFTAGNLEQQELTGGTAGNMEQQERESNGGEATTTAGAGTRESSHPEDRPN